MRRKTREEKAITLIALIITIVVLLILAVVAINAVTGDGIIQHATNAKTEYEKAQDEEESILSYYGEYLDNKGNIGPWRQSGDNIIKDNQDGTQTVLKIGDKVNYNELPNGQKQSHTILYTESGKASESNNQTLETEDLEWVVLGKNSKGQVELISTTATLKDSNKISLYGKIGYINSETILNNTCNKLYGAGVNSKAEKIATARSLNVNDIEKLMGIENDEQRKNMYDKYKEKIEYAYNSNTGKIKYSEDNWKTSTDFDLSELDLISEVISEENPGPVTLEHEYYYDQGSIYTNENYEMLNILAGDANITYWLASKIKYFEISKKRPVFATRIVMDGDLLQYYDYTFGANKEYESGAFSIRPVITLNSNVELDKDANGIWQIK